ncbi:MAG: hypothetical protein LBL97_05020 [Prevotellaceae bacterium]|jgi:hypothetical protein|nr:hypothetical protein [Prevotellaceae bacterium]
MKKISLFIGIIAGMLTMHGCIDENLLPGGDSDANNVYVTLTLNAPSGDNIAATRGATEEKAERTIQNISVLVFRRETSSGGAVTETLAYQAKATDISGGTNGVYSTVVSLVKSTGNDLYNVVVIANKGEDVGYSLYGKTREEVQQALTFNYSGDWSMTDGKNAPFPMWGESYFGKIDKDSYLSQAASISMLRALARVDVGLSFTPTAEGSLQSEAFAGISGWTLKSVHLYRTRTQGCVIPAATAYDTDSKSVTAPTVPGSASLNNPGNAGVVDGGKIYQSPNVTGSVSNLASGSVHQIYIPENTAASDETATAVVVGLEEQSSSKTYYYRIDLGGNRNTLKPILRNYRYVLSITGVNGQGMDTPDDALHAVRANLDYVVLPWNENGRSDLWVSGNYYFRVDKREVVLPARELSDYTQDDAYSLRYETNLPLDSIQWQWDSENPPIDYTVKHEPATSADAANVGLFQFAAKGNNTGVNDIVAHLKFTAGQITGTITVRQLHIPMDYTIACDKDVAVKGIFYVGDNPAEAGYDDSHYLEVTLNNISAGMIGETWRIHTVPYVDEAGKPTNINGLTFSGTGTFTTLGRQHVRLYIDPNSYNNSYAGYEQKLYPAQKLRYKLVTNSTVYGTDSVACEDLNVAIAFHKKKILAIGWGGRSGLGYYAESGASRAFLESDNFSLNGAKGIPINGFDFDCDNVYSSSIVPNLVAKVQAKPDIILASNLSLGNNALAAAMVDYVNAGGVLFVYNGTAIYFAGNTVTNAGQGQLAGNKGAECWDNLIKITNDGTIGGKVGSKFLFNYYKNNGFESGDGGTEELRQRLLVPDDDPIYSGNMDGVQYFGRLDTIDNNIGAYWGNAVPKGSELGETGQFAHFETAYGGGTGSNITNAPYEKFVIYSFGSYSSSYPRYKNFNFFRYKPKNLLYIGDGGWIGGYSKEAEDSSGTYDTGEKDDQNTPFAVYWEETADGWVVTGAKEKSWRGGGAGLSGKGPVHNSLIFANCMAWAIYQAEFHGINSGGLPPY